jgi:hypothetical protein
MKTCILHVYQPSILKNTLPLMHQSSLVGGIVTQFLVGSTGGIPAKSTEMGWKLPCCPVLCKLLPTFTCFGKKTKKTSLAGVLFAN